MAVHCRSIDVRPLYYVKGATEYIMDKCQYFLQPDGTFSRLTDSDRARVREVERRVSEFGLRVLSLAYGADVDDLVYIGLVGMHDPPRPGVVDAIERLMAGGVKIVMITGDSKETAYSVANQLHLRYFLNDSTMLSGQQVESMSEAQLIARIPSVVVFYRASPKHKLAIVKAYQSTNAVVGMTGDGVNDAPALKRADVGIAIGRSGTDVCKEAADMILVDDNFGTILSAIEEGKSIYYNIKNFLRFQLSTSVAALTLIALSTFLGLPSPMNPMQILWINIIMDGPPAQSLGVEPVDSDIMNKPPRKKDAPMITRRLLYKVAVSAFVIVVGTIFVYITEMTDGEVTRHDSTMTFTAFVFFDMFNALNCRSERKSVFSLGWFSNKMFLLAVGGSIIGQLIVIYVPFFQSVFQTEALALSDLVYLVVLTSSVFWIDECAKCYKRKRLRKKTSQTSLIV